MHYILACDERGTTRWPSSTNTWSLGGLIFEVNEHKKLISTWNHIKMKLCGQENVELKWSHFFPGYHQKKMINPLNEQDPLMWREHAIWALRELFENTQAVPVSTYVRKNEASDEIFHTTEDNRKVLNIDRIWIGILGQFAVFLKEKNSTGEIWFDNLGSQKEQSKKEEDWNKLRNAEWSVNLDHQKQIKSIASDLKFFNSKLEPIVQIADFISGVIWAASEGDEIFLLKFLDKYKTKGKLTFRILRIE